MILLVLVLWSFIVLGEPRPIQRDAKSGIALRIGMLPRVNVTVLQDSTMELAARHAATEIPAAISAQQQACKTCKVRRLPTDTITPSKSPISRVSSCCGITSALTGTQTTSSLPVPCLASFSDKVSSVGCTTVSIIFFLQRPTSTETTLSLQASVYRFHDTFTPTVAPSSTLDPAAPSSTTGGPMLAPTTSKQSFIVEAFTSVAAFLNDIAESFTSIHASVYAIAFSSMGILAVLFRLIRACVNPAGTEEGSSTCSTGTTGRTMDLGARTSLERGQAT